MSEAQHAQDAEQVLRRRRAAAELAEPALPRPGVPARPVLLRLSHRLPVGRHQSRDHLGRHLHPRPDRRLLVGLRRLRALAGRRSSGHAARALAPALAARRGHLAAHQGPLQLGRHLEGPRLPVSSSSRSACCRSSSWSAWARPRWAGGGAVLLPFRATRPAPTASSTTASTSASGPSTGSGRPCCSCRSACSWRSSRSTRSTASRRCGGPWPAGCCSPDTAPRPRRSRRRACGPAAGAAGAAAGVHAAGDGPGHRRPAGRLARSTRRYPTQPGGPCLRRSVGGGRRARRPAALSAGSLPAGALPAAAAPQPGPQPGPATRARQPGAPWASGPWSGAPWAQWPPMFGAAAAASPARPARRLRPPRLPNAATEPSPDARTAGRPSRETAAAETATDGEPPAQEEQP